MKKVEGPNFWNFLVRQGPRGSYLGGRPCRLFRENQATDCQEIEDSRTDCCEETDRARQARNDELSMHQERNPTTESQLLAQIQDLQNKVNSLSDAREIYDPETASSSGATHVSESQVHVLPRFWIAARCTEYCGYLRKRYWTSTYSRRTNLCSLRKFKEFGILFSRIETWHSRKCNGTGKGEP